MALIPKTETPLSREAAESALIAAWGEFEDQTPNTNQLALLMAQSALETGQWRRMSNYNFGQLRARVDPETGDVQSGINKFWAGDYYQNPDDGEPDKPQLYRSYVHPSDGAKDYARILFARPAWREGLLSGEPAVFARALKDPPAYYQAPEGRYREGLTALWKQFGGSAPAPTPIAQQPSTIDRAVFKTVAPLALLTLTVALVAKARR